MFRPIRLSRLAIASTVVAALAGAAAPRMATAADVVYRRSVTDLKFTGPPLPAAYQTPRWSSWRTLGQALSPYATIEGAGEVVVYQEADANRWAAPPNWTAGADLVVKVPAARPVVGVLYWPNAEQTALEKHPFELDAAPVDDGQKIWNQAELQHYQRLLDRDISGAAWFRHQAREARLALDQTPDVAARVNPWNRRNVDRLDDTFDLFSGGQAISENLQLDRILPATAKNEKLVPLDKIQGITVAEIDWKPLIQDVKPRLDPLAKLVPADQHALFFPSFNALVQLSDKLAAQGTIILRLAEPRVVDARLVERYERQLGLSLQGLGRIVGPQVVSSVALTGGDPYFATGTDVALVFETPQPELVKNLLLAQIAVSAQKSPGAQQTSGTNGPLQFTGMRSPDRAISSYVATLPGAVLVTNSPAQLERFAAVAAGKSPAIASLDEFVFFRNRYPLGDKEESALLFLSDATIRRWCGPRWRIATSRETRDAAVLAELQAAYLDPLVGGKVVAGPLHTDLPIAAAGELTLAADGVRSAALGDLEFITPIGELKFNEVTQAEADAYDRWRQGYQTNWRWAFDPIAVRLSVADQRLAADLTVMPLIAGTEYREFINLSRGAKIAPNAGDPHDALLHFALALNAKTLRQNSAGNLVGIMAQQAKLDPFGWLGESVALYADADPFWGELAACETDEDREKFLTRNTRRVPIALWVEVSSGLKLTAFLAGLHGFIDQSAPGMSQWETLEYHGQPYVRITATERALPQDDPDRPDPQLLYAATGKFLLVTLSEDVLKRAVDRQAAAAPSANAKADKSTTSPVKAESTAAKAETAKADTAAKAAPAPHPWLGSSMAFQADTRAMQLVGKLLGPQLQEQTQAQSWNNLPILNEWHRRYPGQDPVALHERFWHQRLVCPGGGKYVWNDAWQTMESTVYGHPGEPKSGPPAPPQLLNFSFANFGLTFENNGLRARMTLDRPQPEAAAAGK